MFVQTSENRWIYFVVIFVLSFAFLFFFNPSRDIAGEKEKEKILKPFIPSVFSIKALSQAQKTELSLNYKVSQYRGDSKRQGFYRVGFSFEKARLIDEKENLLSENVTTSQNLLTPILSKDFVLTFENGNTLKVLNKSDYTNHWSIKLSDSKEGELLGSPVAFLNYAVVASASGKAYFIDLKNKELISTLEVGVGINSHLLFHKGSVYVNVASEIKNNFLIRWDLLENKVKWASDYINSGSVSAPTMGTESVFFGDNQGYLYSVSVEDGKILWAKKFDYPITSSPVTFKDQVIFKTKNGNVISLDQSSGVQNWVNPITEPGLSELSVHPMLGALVFKTDLAMYKFDLSTGQRTSRLKLRFKTKSSPVIVENREDLYIFTACRVLEICMFKYKGPQLLRLYTIKSELENQILIDTNKLLIFTNGNNKVSSIRKPDPKVRRVTAPTTEAVVN